MPSTFRLKAKGTEDADKEPEKGNYFSPCRKWLDPRCGCVATDAANV
jgi:hypothetical protein